MNKNALRIGANHYPGIRMDLQGCVNDANDWTQILQARGLAITALLNALAAKATMVQAMPILIGVRVAGDSQAIRYSGHGTYQPDTDGDEVDGLVRGPVPVRHPKPHKLNNYRFTSPLIAKSC